ncbi:TIGR01777 family oxidoreductase [Phocoenobacter skyensis]|uniref:TIGR01777 family oxidoreductase n=1 Tax=Phocoenobacter skyensis TaxID=97481 RepID=A0A1H7UUG6_9PAST|nr:TIGR01777 family oxidoreductase [Pasteurella skyensis]MDP8078578.1 TIGR01777 family oxidoreductase [Pasteurella skyensis]MDP8084330.1 TIGR01777 family oxidoreductase [Pasteurella skyensis]MDP8162054.1 TIGR01777 family oxidoreductase [Pasteurella skyensis]MDP8172210.1 TIGR01777 family oxidoreductase [Pasteurella skyensis]MDP8176441.1 TIGR01777 family oxidoreductase [Pasteurella skyensis]
MHIFITGGTGFIGKALTDHLLSQGHSVTVLTRQNLSGKFPLTFCNNLTDIQNFNDTDVIINLAGEPIFDKAWTPKQKQILVDSRIKITQQLVHLINKSENPPKVFLSGSAIGIYGNTTNIATENTPCDTSFTGQLCKQWEMVASEVKNTQTRICFIRTGLVLSPQGGILKRILPIYRLGLGGKIGTGKQHWSWISLEDHIQAMLFLIENEKCMDAFNFVAPEIITQETFNHQLATTLHRPAFFHIPTFVLKFFLKERSQLLLDNQLITPKMLLNQGFKFKHNCLKNYLNKLL